MVSIRALPIFIRPITPVALFVLAAARATNIILVRELGNQSFFGCLWVR